MRTDIRCRQCQSKLSVKSELMGKTIRCPKCTNPLKVSVAPVILPQLGNKPGASPMMAVPVDEEPMWAEVLPDDAGFDVLPDEEPAPPPPAVIARPKSRPVRALTPVAVDETVDEEEEKPRPRKKKKKKLSNSKSATSIPTWMWVLGGLGALVATGGLIFGLVLLMRMATPDGEDINWTEHFIIFCISVPISLVILILSMFISSALGGGINFGEAKLAIIGSIFLIVIVNIVSQVPVVGRYLTLIVWLVGFMTIFGLDPWEARFLLLINWVLNYAISMMVIHLMIAHINREVEVPGDEEDKPIKRKSREKRGGWDIKPRPEVPDPDDDNLGYHRPNEWHERMQAWIESQRPGKVVVL